MQKNVLLVSSPSFLNLLQHRYNERRESTQLQTMRSQPEVDASTQGSKQEVAASSRFIVIGMQNDETYRRQLLPLSVEHIDVSMPPHSRWGPGGARGRQGRFTFLTTPSNKSHEFPKWWSPLLDNIIPAEASITMKPKESTGVITALAEVEKDVVVSKGRDADKRRAGKVGGAASGTAGGQVPISWEVLEDKVSVKR
jgi:hypothetical protein